MMLQASRFVGGKFVSLLASADGKLVDAGVLQPIENFETNEPKDAASIKVRPSPTRCWCYSNGGKPDARLAHAAQCTAISAAASILNIVTVLLRFF